MYNAAFVLPTCMLFFSELMVPQHRHLRTACRIIFIASPKQIYHYSLIRYICHDTTRKSTAQHTTRWHNIPYTTKTQVIQSANTANCHCHAMYTDTNFIHSTGLYVYRYANSYTVVLLPFTAFPVTSLLLPSDFIGFVSRLLLGPF